VSLCYVVHRWERYYVKERVWEKCLFILKKKIWIIQLFTINFFFCLLYQNNTFLRQVRKIYEVVIVDKLVSNWISFCHVAKFYREIGKIILQFSNFFFFCFLIIYTLLNHMICLQNWILCKIYGNLHIRYYFKIIL
jgi:hypothetical protein